MIGSTLAEFFSGAAGKLLSAVEVHPDSSNQHEFNGVSRLAELLGTPPAGGERIETRFMFVDDELQVTTAVGSMTWYDARARHPTRSELRLYYPRNPVMALASPGDYLVLARPIGPACEAVVIIAPASSSVASQLQALFGLEESDRLDVEAATDNRRLNFTARELLEALGYETALIQSSRLEEMIHMFGGGFPSTATFSSYARSTVPDIDGLTDPDEALIAWMEQEESLYRTLERHLVQAQFADASGDVDEVLAISMRTFQRRRSRAGQALENHVAHVFDEASVQYERQVRTEGSKRPDFLFPGRDVYLNPVVPSERKRMLGVKTTCKDRWRQVLTEADLILEKHLLTLEAPISLAQTQEMRERRLTLVLPRPLHEQFQPEQRPDLLSVEDMIRMLLAGQS